MSMSHHEPAEQHEHTGTSHFCKVCTSTFNPGHKASLMGLCPHCVYKILIVVVVCMVVVSYIAWFALF
jgi:DNA-directed RNA polymerase subunit RPC12/RpoP